MFTYYMNGPQVGKATSNTFDGDKVLDDGNFILKGIQRQSDIGLLSLFEHYHSIVVGSFLKAPVYPIWLVCAESHFTVLFATQKGTINSIKAKLLLSALGYQLRCPIMNFEEILFYKMPETVTFQTKKWKFY